MSDTASHDVSELQGAAGTVRDLALGTQLGAVAMTVKLLTLRCWGDDEIGTAFEHAYLAGATEVMEQLLDVGPQVGQIADALAASAGGYADTEDTNTTAATTGTGSGPVVDV